MGREDLAGVEGDDRDLMLVDDGQDPLTGMSRTDVEVMEPAGPAQGDPALPVGHVVAEPEVAPGAGAGGHRLGRRPVRLAGRDPADCPVGPLLVVGEAKGVEPLLELSNAGRRRTLSEPALQGLVEALDPYRSG